MTAWIAVLDILHMQPCIEQPAGVHFLIRPTLPILHAHAGKSCAASSHAFASAARHLRTSRCCPRALALALAGLPTRLRACGSHLVGPGRRPHLRMQGAHVEAEVAGVSTPGLGSVPAGPSSSGSSGGGGGGGTEAGGGVGGGGGLRPLAPAYQELAGQVVAATLPGSHRAEAVDAFAVGGLAVGFGYG